MPQNKYGMTEISLLQSQMLKLSAIEPNKGQIEGLPKNPRFIKDAKFKKLVQSIEEHPEMTAMRELLVYPLDNGKYIIIGGNMRYRAMKELGIKEAPCKVIPQDTTIEQLQAYTLKDNKLSNAKTSGGVRNVPKGSVTHQNRINEVKQTTSINCLINI